jgi:ATP-dependent RNA helicase DeaD
MDWKTEMADEETTTTPTTTETESRDGFDTLGLDPKLVSTLSELGYEEPTPIQREAIPALLTGRDLIGQAATGTGKTAAFALPILQRISQAGKERPMPSALILVPTRELAMQVAEAMHKYGQRLKLTTIAVYGGQSFGQQARMLERGVDVVVATPGRALDHLRRQTMNLAGITTLALDEADEMLDMGFAEDLEAILSEVPAERQTVFFSATLPPRIAGMVKRHMRDPQRIEIAKEKVPKGAAPKVRQTAYIIPRRQKLEVLGRVLDLENPQSALVFCRTRTEVDNLTERLSAHGYRAQALHGGITQDQRSKVVKRLREGAIDLVVATDVAARGLDIENLQLVVNYDVPTSPESYTHRIGRVGRAGREGVAITLADPRESRLLKMFERLTKGRIDIASVPTIADLRARRLELTRASVEEAIAAGNLDRYRVVVEALAHEHDPMTVALAAVKLAHQAAGGDRDEDEEGEEIEDLRPREREDRPRRPGGRFERDDRPQRAERREERHEREERPQRAERPQEGEERPRKPKHPTRHADRHTRPNAGFGRIYVGAGRLAGLRPQDLVGAIAGESGLEGRRIGAIEIADKYSVVELPEEAVEDVVRAMRKASIRGKKVVVRRFVDKS